MKYFFSRFGIGVAFLAVLAAIVYGIAVFIKIFLIGLTFISAVLIAFLIGDFCLGDNPSTTKGYPR